MVVDQMLNRIIHELNESFLNSNNKSIDITFDIIENHVFIFIKTNNGLSLKKVDLKINKEDLGTFYIQLYEKLKNYYLTSPIVSIGIYQNTNLAYPDNYFLAMVLKEVHQNKLTIEFKDQGLEKEALETIKNNWINLVNEEKMKKMK